MYIFQNLGAFNYLFVLETLEKFLQGLVLLVVNKKRSYQAYSSNKGDGKGSTSMYSSKHWKAWPYANEGLKMALEGNYNKLIVSIDQAQ